MLLQEEFNRKRGLFDDDLAFIREVKELETAAAGMDPDTELQTLHKRFSNWKHEFKVTHCLHMSTRQGCATTRMASRHSSLVSGTTSSCNAAP